MALVAISDRILWLLLVNVFTCVSSAPLHFHLYQLISSQPGIDNLRPNQEDALKLDECGFNDTTVSPRDSDLIDAFTPTVPVFLFTAAPSGLYPTQSPDISLITVVEPVTTITVQNPPETTVVTITEIFTISTSLQPVPNPSEPPIPSQPAETSSSTFPFVPRSTQWALPPKFTSVEDAFNIEHFAYGRENVRLIQSPSVGVLYELPNGSPRFMGTAEGNESRDGQTVLQVVYPRGSYSPSHWPRGGADFYSTPPFSIDSDEFEMTTIPAAVAPSVVAKEETGSGGTISSLEMLKRANNVTLSYSVYFPPDFDFVKGGKLPGLYGGRQRCSGGDDALDCFSTRLMWRGGGKGELYLYAPKDVQADSLCSTPPRSNCDTVYGLSIGRGSFVFERGMWTHARQTVWLNSIGRRNGGFILEIGKGDDRLSMRTVLSNAEVYYRSRNGDGGGPYDASTWGIDDLHAEDDEPSWIEPASSEADANQGSRPLLFEAPELFPATPSPTLPDWDSNGDGLGPRVVTMTVYAVEGTKTVTVPNSSTVTSTVTVARTVFRTGGGGGKMGSATSATGSEPRATNTPVSSSEAKSGPGEPIGFAGIFFSTFFGGSTPDWASPKDQYVLFKDFQVTING